MIPTAKVVLLVLVAATAAAAMASEPFLLAPKTMAVTGQLPQDRPRELTARQQEALKSLQGHLAYLFGEAEAQHKPLTGSAEAKIGTMFKDFLLAFCEHREQGQARSAALAQGSALAKDIVIKIPGRGTPVPLPLDTNTAGTMTAQGRKLGGAAPTSSFDGNPMAVLQTNYDAIHIQIENAIKAAAQGSPAGVQTRIANDQRDGLQPDHPQPE